MSQISLKEFTGQIRQRIDEERASEAIPMAQYLLRQYPRYLKGYELLAEAALQQGNIKDAIEVFRRVLSADPENLIAYRGMAAAYAEEEEIGEALWYMMRAFERDPRVRGIRQELRHLYHLRDGRRPGRLNLNRAALARMYMREGLYHRAIEELNVELESGPHGPASDRVDLLIALAEAQWFANQRSDAARTAQKVRLELPYCLKANLLLAEFYAQQADLASADIHLRIAEQMDPENDLAIELFGNSGYLQPNHIMIESLAEAWKTAQPGSDQEHKMPEWLADLSLFATAEPQEQEVDWDAIIAYETDWRTVLAKTTHEAIRNFVPNWRVDLRHATRLSLNKRQDEQAEEAISEITEQRLPLILESTEQPLPPILGLDKELLSASEEAKEKSLDTLSEPSSTSLDVVPSQLAAPDWRDALQEATREALKDATASLLSTAKAADMVQAKEEAAPEAIKEEELALGTRWKEELRAETEPWLTEIEPSVEPKAIEPSESLIIPSVPSIEPEQSWRSSLAEATRAEFKALEEAREKAKAVPEVIKATKPTWVEGLREESQELREAEVPQSLPEAVEPAKRAWVEALREESQELPSMPFTEELTQGIAASEPPFLRTSQEKVSPITLGLGKEWRAALRAETETVLAKRQEAITAKEEQEADREERVAQPIEAVPQLLTSEPEKEAFTEAAVIPLPAEAAWASALREETQEQLEKLSIATSPWVIALRGATEEQLEKLSPAETTWASALRDDSQRQLEALSVGATVWAIALRRETQEQLESLSAAESPWAKDLRHLTEQQLLTLSSTGTPWAKNLHQETKNLFGWIDEGKKGWISALQDDSQYALNAYEEIHRAPPISPEVAEAPSRKEELSWLLPEQESQATTVSLEVSPQEADIMAPVEPSQSDFIASLMAAAEKVAGDEEQFSEAAEDFWDEIGVEETENLPELSFGKAEEREIKEPVALPTKDEPKAREEERSEQALSPPKRASKAESEPPREAIIEPTPASPVKAAPSEAKPTDEWQTARWLWETKQDKEALAIYQRIFDERKGSDEKLQEELSAWANTGNASALAYQLLGDLYRRMGRMQDAVVQYREAINRM